MSKLSNREKLILRYIVTNCEIFHLNESEALEHVKNNFSKPISRRTFYLYKNQIYKIHEEKSSYFKLFKIEGYNNHNNLISLLLTIENKKMKEEALKEKNIRLDEYERISYLPRYFERLYDSIYATSEQVKKFLNGINIERQLIIENTKSIPNNATIRKEYVKCGKLLCTRCKHGPYYYAYWKDKNSKLNKKYIGRYATI